MSGHLFDLDQLAGVALDGTLLTALTAHVEAVATYLEARGMPVELRAELLAEALRLGQETADLAGRLGDVVEVAKAHDRTEGGDL